MTVVTIAVEACATIAAIVASYVEVRLRWERRRHRPPK